MKKVKQLIKQILFDFSSRKKKFAHIYTNNLFGGDESISGPGSSLEQTQTIREALPHIVRKFNICTFVDAPCGDFHWMSRVALGVEKYIGIDIVPKLIEDNRHKYGSFDREFRCMDIVRDALPGTDLIMCRDCFIHLSNKEVYAAVKNIKRAGYTYILTTTFPHTKVNGDISTGRVRLLNLQSPPFNFPEPILLLNENCTEGGGRYSDKSLGLWKLHDIKIN